MSSNNQIFIKKIDSIFEIRDRCIEGGKGILIGMASNLEEATKKANNYMKENIVEYGLRIEL